MRHLLLVLMLAATLVAGCIGQGGEPAGDSGELPEFDDGESENQSFNESDVSNESTIDIKEETQFDPSSQVHPHDFWGGQEEITIVDRDVSIDWASEIQADQDVLHNPTFIVDILPETTADEEALPNNVFPGTGEINITLSWNGGTGGMLMCVVNNGATGNLCSNGIGNWFESSGDTWAIDKNTTDEPDEEGEPVLTEETWDEPHSLKSDWRFQIWVCTRGDQEEIFSRCAADLDVDSFHVTVTIVRGDSELPVDPPHFAFYGDKETITILETTSISGGPVQSNWIGQADRQVRQDSRAYWYISGFHLTNPPLADRSEVPVVALQTKRLEATLDVQAANADQSPLELRYRTARHHWSADWEVAGDPCSGTCTYEIGVDKAGADSPYAHRTQWEFGIFPANAPTVPLADYEVSLGLVGHKTAE